MAQASPTLITSFYSTAAYGTAYRRTDTAGTDTPIDQQITITSPVSVSSMDLYVGNTGAPVAQSNVTVSIYSDSAGQVGSLIDTAVNPASAFSLNTFPLTTFTFPDDPTLSPGNYWVQLSDSSTSPIRWLQQNVLTDTSTSPGGFGTINDDVYYLGAYYNSPGTATSKDFILNINGTAAVPEPASVSILGVAAIGLATPRRRSRQGWGRGGSGTGAGNEVGTSEGDER